MTPAPRYRLGVDVGGTFTDIVLADPRTGDLRSAKVPSDAHNPARAVVSGVRAVLDEAGVRPDQVEYFSHGQTFALNTVLQRSGARVGLLVTRGFPDLLDIGRLRLEDPIDLFAEPRRSPVAREDVREVSARVSAGGREVRPLDAAEVAAAADDLVASGVEAIAVVFLHGHRHPAHERAAREAVLKAHPDLPVACSSALWPEEREYERGIVAVLAAHVGRALEGYLDHLVRELRALGLDCPLHITKSNGGVASIVHEPGEVLRAAVETLLSGPASGVAGAARTARAAGTDRFITMDMGGTSVDCAIVDGAVPYSTESSLGGLPLIIPSVEVSSIGAGGGSIVRVDAAGVLKVGPRSAGAFPGPAAYLRGGTEPTLTDAYAVCGYLDPSDFAEGGVPLDAGAARRALAPVAAALGTSVEEAAEAAVAVATAMMHAQLVPMCAQRGVDPGGFTLVAYGGAGPVQAALLARALNTAEVLVPASPGTLCAYGALATDLRTDVVAPAPRPVTDASLARGWEELEARARAWYAAQENALHPSVHVTRWADVQLQGQSFTLPIVLPDGAEPSVGALRTAFARAYRKAYSVDPGEGALDVRSLRVGLTASSRMAGHTAAGTGRAAERIPHRVVEGGEPREAVVLRRPSLAPGTRFHGPAVVTAPDTTVYVPSGFTAVVDGAADLRIRANDREERTERA